LLILTLAISARSISHYFKEHFINDFVCYGVRLCNQSIEKLQTLARLAEATRTRDKLPRSTVNISKETTGT
jgi:hypothetical protein